LNNKIQRTEEKNNTNDQQAGKPRPFSRRTFRKEVNTLARKAGKKKVLGLYAAALKREQAKEKNGRKGKARRANESDDDSTSSGSAMSVHNLERAIPRKKTSAKVNRNRKDTKVSGSGEMDDEEFEFVEQINNMSIEEDYQLVDAYNDDELSITSEDM
jgi:hypothetical protein